MRPISRRAEAFVAVGFVIGVISIEKDNLAFAFKRENMRGIAPDEVGRIAVRDDDAQVAAIHVRRDEAR